MSNFQCPKFPEQSRARQQAAVADLSQAGVRLSNCRLLTRAALFSPTLDFGLWTFAGLWTHQFARQPIEQFRMGWRLDAGAEIFRGRHQAGPEIGLPDSVDEHAGGGRTAGIDKPLGEAQSIVRCVFGKRM